ncbi:hypothetical protein EVAR_39157_1 [Eumeta japonica]|uniref:Uncharacterized protein n=1 Tax=Eumeta variegata TaxID=151549 RepID=A0A4C1X5M5_EUMVA|nr:hypothetical protein EVAR_39157_1 [Eumeta japonica]
MLQQSKRQLSVDICSEGNSLIFNRILRGAAATTTDEPYEASCGVPMAHIPSPSAHFSRLQSTPPHHQFTPCFTTHPIPFQESGNALMTIPELRMSTGNESVREIASKYVAHSQWMQIPQKLLWQYSLRVILILRLPAAFKKKLGSYYNQAFR